MNVKRKQGNYINAESLSLTLDSSSFVPYYEQIVEQIRSLARDNRLKEGDIFCSEGDIAGVLGISKMPVRHAFQKLRSEGLLIVAKGKRPLIGSGRVPWNFQQLRGFSEEMRRRGLIPSTQLLSLDLQQPMPEIAQILKLPPEEQVYCLKRLRYVNGQPVAIVTSYLPARLFAGIENLDLEKKSLYHLFEHHYKRKLQWAEEAICAKTATEEEGRVLHTQPGSPLLFVKETTYDTKSIVIEYSISLLRADRYTAMVISLRKN